METINGQTFEEASAKVQGSKYKALNTFKVHTVPGFGIEDMKSELDIALFNAWREWDPEQSKFNTYATNRFNWALFRALETHSPKFKMNALTKADLKAQGETFETLAKNKKTSDAQFNAAYKLDGTKPFTKEIWRQYVYSRTAKTFGICMINQSQFTSSEDAEFDIMDVAGATDDDSYHFDIMMEHDIQQLDPVKQKIAKMLLDGADIKAVAKEVGMSAVRLLQTYAPNENSNKRATKACQARARKRAKRHTVQ